MLKIYIATPINGRHEPTREKKLEAARKRVGMLKGLLADGICENGLCYTFGEKVSTFDVNDDDTDEATAMGRCIELIMKCDAIYLDHGWLQSKGCNLEYRCAKIYGLAVFEHDRL